MSTTKPMPRGQSGRRKPPTPAEGAARPPGDEADPSADSPAAAAGLERVVDLLRRHSGHDFSQYKKSGLRRRIERRMTLHEMPDLAAYAASLQDNPQELELLFKEMLIGVTRFFRDPAVWEQLRREVLPALIARRPPGSVLRAWVPGCSTGEEAYTLAIVIKEALRDCHAIDTHSVQIFATDVNTAAIARARLGRFPANVANEVSDEQLQRFFIPVEQGFQVRKDVRESLVFAAQNVAVDPPFIKLDVLSCRNLFIYLESGLQSRLLPMFHYGLNDDGVLLLGSAETTGGASSLFEPLPGANRIYHRRSGVTRLSLPALAASFTGAAAGKPSAVGVVPFGAPSVAPVNLKALADEVLLQHFPAAALLVNALGDILYVSGRTGSYLEPAAGKANLNLFAMAREGLNLALDENFHEALRQGAPIVLKHVRVGHGAAAVAVDLALHPLLEPGPLKGMVMVVFRERTWSPSAPPLNLDPLDGPGTDQARLASLVRELQRSREELQSTREEMTASQEELQSANEDMQSTNEELTTAKEEMHAINEELQTLNQELQSKVEELSHTADDMENLLDATDIATLFVDADLRVRRFTTKTTRLIKLIAGDIGRPITDITGEFDPATLADDARGVLRTLASAERELPTRDGRWYRVRTMPYWTERKAVSGVVITFTNVSRAKAQEQALHDVQARLALCIADPSADAAVQLERLRACLQASRTGPVDEARVPSGEPLR